MKKVEPIKDKADIRRMLDYLEGQSMRDAILFRLGLNTILRVSDLLQLKVSDFYTLGGKFRTHVTLKESKTGKVKKIKLNRVSRKIIPNHIQHYHLSGDDFLFFSTQNPDKPIDRHQAWRLLKKAAVYCGLDNFGTHSMRKTLAYHVYKQTNDIALTMKLLNHRSPDVTLKYIGVEQEEIDGAYDNHAL